MRAHVNIVHFNFASNDGGMTVVVAAAASAVVKFV